MLHDKYHGGNHFTYLPVSGVEPDLGRDSIASHDAPFQGDFVMEGTFVSTIDTNLKNAAIVKTDFTGLYADGSLLSLDVYGVSIFDNDLCNGGLVLTQTVLSSVDLTDARLTNKTIKVNTKNTTKYLRLWKVDQNVLIDQPPRFTIQPSITQLDYDSGKTRFICDTIGTSPITYQWFINGAPQKGETGKTILADSAGVYYVEASNSMGTTRSMLVYLTPKPIANIDYIFAKPLAQTSFNVLLNDAVYSPVTVSIVSKPKYGLINLDDSSNELTYIPNYRYPGYDTIVYEIRDRLDRTATTTVVLSCDVTPIQATDEIIMVDLRKPTVFDIGGNVKVGNLDYNITDYTRPSYGDITVYNATFTAAYFPKPSFRGFDKFQYIIKDAANNNVTVNVTLSGLYTALSATNDVINVSFIGSSTFNIFKNDIRGSYTYYINTFTLPSYGSLALNKNTGEATYTPTIYYPGQDKFEYTIIDESGSTSIGTVTVSSTLPTDWQYGAITCPGETPISWKFTEIANTQWHLISCQADHAIEGDDGTPIDIQGPDTIDT